MQRLNLTDYLFTILVILVLAATISYGAQKWLLHLTEATGGKIEHAGADY